MELRIGTYVNKTNRCHIHEIKGEWCVYSFESWGAHTANAPIKAMISYLQKNKFARKCIQL